MYKRQLPPGTAEDLKIRRDSNERSFHLDFDEAGFASNSAKIWGGGRGAAPLGPPGSTGPGHYKTVEMINLTSEEIRQFHFL